MKAVSLKSTSDSALAKKQQKAVSHPLPASPWSIQPVSVFDGSVIQRKSSCACGGDCPRCAQETHPATIQTKLQLSTPGDAYEREADRVAEQIMRMPETTAHARAGVGRQSAELQTQRKCAPCADSRLDAAHDDEENLQAKEIRAQAPSLATESQSQVDAMRASGGEPLPSAARAFFEPRFGYSFGSVRVHADGRAAESARALNAVAYTVGPNVIFGAGQYAPETTSGRELLAHELAHVVQQRGGSSLLGLSGAVTGMRQRRTIRREYSTTQSERGPLCDVTLAITGAPDSDSPQVTDFVDAAMDGIMSACGSLGRQGRQLRVTLRYRRNLNHGEISNEAYIAARVSVLGASAIPPTPEQVLETERVAALNASYDRALRNGNWSQAAETLNAFNDADINTRLRRLTGLQLPQMRLGATRNPALAGGARLTAAIDAVNPDARRVAGLLDQFEQARQGGDWSRAAELLNAFNDEDIRTLLRTLLPSQLPLLRDGALRNPVLAGGGRLTALIDAATAGAPAEAIGLVCFDQATVTASKNGRVHSCAAITSANAPTPSGRFCVRRQGDAMIAGGFVGRFVQTRTRWYLIEPQFSSTRFRMDLHPGSRSEGCVTVTNSSCFDQLAAVINQPGSDSATGYDGYPPGNPIGVTNPPRQVSCVAWLDVVSSIGGCRR